MLSAHEPVIDFLCIVVSEIIKDFLPGITGIEHKLSSEHLQK